jgi:hypothetical protein
LAVLLPLLVSLNFRIAYSPPSRRHQGTFTSLSFPTSSCTLVSWPRKAKKVKFNASSSPKYVTSDDDDSLPSKLVKKPYAMIKGLMKQVGVRDELLEQQEELLIQERKCNVELKKLLALEKGKVEKLDQELAKSKEATCNLKSSIGALQGQHDVLQKTHHDLEVQFDARWSSTSKTSSNHEASQASNVKKVLVETCDVAIGKENDHWKREVKKLELELNKLKKQAKVQPPQDNSSNMVKKLLEWKNYTKD